MTPIQGASRALTEAGYSTLNKGRKYTKPLDEKLVVVFRKTEEGIERLEPPIKLEQFERQFGKNVDGSHLYSTKLDATPKDMKSIFSMMA